jgi:hypothetical protein
MYKFININDVKYIVKRSFPFSKVKDEMELRDILHLYGADTLLRENKSQQFVLVSKVDDANILSETELLTEKQNEIIEVE